MVCAMQGSDGHLLVVPREEISKLIDANATPRSSDQAKTPEMSPEGAAACRHLTSATATLP